MSKFNYLVLSGISGYMADNEIECSTLKEAYSAFTQEKRELRDSLRESGYPVVCNGSAKSELAYIDIPGDYTFQRRYVEIVKVPANVSY